MLKRTDEIRLQELRSKIDNCTICHGTDLGCNCYRDYQFVLAQINSNIPAKYQNFQLSDIGEPNSQKMVKKITSFIKSIKDYRRQGIGLYLFGNPGTAKSVLGCIVLNAALRRRYRCYFTNVTHYLSLVTDRNNPESKQSVKHISSVDFLLIDDIGREFRDSKGFIESHLDELIRFRTDNLLPTIITTNKSQNDLAESNVRLLSILQEHFIAVSFPTRDYRKKLGAALANG